jgi:transcriptional regulator with XRE-family HTH domain
MPEITLKKLRKILRLTQQELAEKMGYNSGYISVLETSDREFSEDFLEKLEETFKIKAKGYTLVKTVDNSSEIHNKGIKNSSINNTIGEAESLRKENEELKKTVIELQKELIEQLKGKKK